MKDFAKKLFSINKDFSSYMKKAVAKTPVTIAALSLSYAAYGKLILNYTNKFFYYLCLFIALFFFLKIILKFLMDFKSVVHDYKNNIILIPLFTLIPMAAVVINSYFFKVSIVITTIIWFLSLCLFLFNSFYFLIKVFKEKHAQRIYPTLFVNLIGIDLLLFNQPGDINILLLKIIFYISFVIYIIAFIIITTLLLKHKHIDDGTRPFLSIYAAPCGLLTISYSVLFSTPNNILILLLFIIDVLGFCVLIYAFSRTTFGHFKPSLAAFTFPSVANATATKAVAGVFHLTILNYYLYAQIIFAGLTVLYVTFMYVRKIYVHDEI